ncbi:MAG: hypothetical protein Q9201_007878 [Fulgogasparrea decipioides]
MLDSQAQGTAVSTASGLNGPPNNNGRTQKEEVGDVASLIFRNLSVHGFDIRKDHQKTFLTYPLSIFAQLRRKLVGISHNSRVPILQDFEGIVTGGEMLLVLGRPDSGCTTLLKSLTGDTYGLHVDPAALLNYDGMPDSHSQTTNYADCLIDIGVSMTELRKRFRGEYVYVPESDIHFPHLTVAQSLTFASQARLSSTPDLPNDHQHAATKSVEETTKALSLTHALNTKVGNSMVKGISGGERKRTSIAEVLVGASRIQCWDNSIRGLGSANALRFIQCIRSTAIEAHTVVVATLYQASEAIYNCFDKVILLYEGREIFFGSTDAAKVYFIELGFVCPDRSTTADFLCSITNPLERIVR